jgi:UPF0755 protein
LLRPPSVPLMAKKSKKAVPKNNPWLRRVAVAIACLLAGALVLAAYLLMGPNTAPFGDKKYFYIPTGSTYKDVLGGLQSQGIIQSTTTFDLAAQRLDYPKRVKAGKYEIKKGMSNLDILRMLRSGKQVPVRLVINKLRTKQDFIRLLSLNLEADSTILKNMLEDPVYLRQFGLNPHTALAAIVPDTYEFYWNTSASTAFEKLESYRKKFWSTERRAQAEKIGLTPNEVTVLASIVEEETNRHDEKPLMASVYINRLRRNMKLGADPTVKFALGDFSIRRISGDMLRNPSPYNTYVHYGLPPGPICTPSPKSINAVLNAAQTTYLFFCAKPDLSGYHDFSTTYEEHLKYARNYHKWLNSRNIQK